MASKNSKLRAAVRKAVTDDLASVGPAGFDKGAVVARFMGKGADRATLYRWVSADLATGRPGQVATRRIKAAASGSAEPADVAAEVGAKLPTVLAVEDVAGTPALRVMEELRAAIADVRAVRTYAKTPEGGVRNAKLILQSAEVLRRCLDTATRIVEAMHEVSQVDRLHSIILEEIAKLSPECAEAICARIGQVATEWGG